MSIFIDGDVLQEKLLDYLVEDLHHTAKKHDLTYDQALETYKALHQHQDAASLKRISDVLEHMSDHGLPAP